VAPPADGAGGEAAVGRAGVNEAVAMSGAETVVLGGPGGADAGGPAIAVLHRKR